MAILSDNVLAGLPKELLEKLFAEAQCRELKAGEVLFKAGEAGDGCYRVQKGLVKVVIESSIGDERIITLLGPEAIVGELAMIDGLPRSASVVAITDCSLHFISRKRFQIYTHSHPEVTDYLMRTLARRLREADDALAAATFLSVKGRVARALLNLAEYVGHNDGKGHIQLRHRLSQTDLAAMAGVARENVSRTMSEWRRRELVSRSAHYYCINDARALAREMEFEQ